MVVWDESGGKDGLQGPEGTFGPVDVHYLDYSDVFPDAYICQNSPNRHFQYVWLIYVKLYIIKIVKNVKRKTSTPKKPPQHSKCH